MLEPAAKGRLPLRQVLLAVAPVGLYLAAVNPYVLPEIYDNVMYYGAARSLLEHGSFEHMGEKVVRWPPGFPLMLAGLFALGLQSVVAVKLFVIACVCVSAVLLLRLLQREAASRPTLRVAAYLLLPQTFLIGTRMMAEFPYIVLALAFLLLLPRCASGPARMGWAVVVGLLLGSASLTRWLGVSLGAGLVWQAGGKLRRGEGLRSVLPEALASSIGAAMCIAQMLHAGTTLDELAVPMPKPVVLPETAPQALHELVARAPDKTAKLTAEDGDAVSLGPILKTTDLMTNAVFNHVGLLRQVGLQRNVVLRAASSVLAFAILAGAFLRLRRGAWTPADAYTMAMIVVLGVVGWGTMRYWVPIAPFLIGYLFELGAWLEPRARRWIGARGTKLWILGVGVWLVTLVVADVHLLARGNGQTHGGLSVLATPTADRFYRGRWADFYALSSRVRRDRTLQPLCVWGDPGIVQYVEAFVGVQGEYFPPARPIGSLVVLPDRPIPGASEPLLGITKLDQRGPYTLYRVHPESALRSIR